MPDQNIEVVRQWVAARDDPDADTHRGAEAIQRYFDSWTEQIKGIRVEATEIREVGDKLFAWIRIVGSGRDSGAGEEYFDRAEGLAAASVGE